jgi:hypothetical protein
MRGFADVERDTRLLRSQAKGKEESVLLDILQNGVADFGLPGLQALADEFVESLKTTSSSADWRTLWRDSAKAAALMLGDCYGIRGGALRRKQDLANAIAAYDEGFTYESEPEFAIPDSYNRVQRLAVRIIHCDHPLRHAEDLKTIAVPVHPTILERVRGATVSGNESTVLVQLEEAEKAIDSMLHVTKIAEGDLWREADLGLVRLLLGTNAPVETLWGSIPRGSTGVFKSTKKVVDELATKLDPAPGGLKSRFGETSAYLADVLGA